MVTINTLNGGDIVITTGSAGHSETRFTLEGGTVETHNITGTLDKQWMIANGYYNGDDYVWIKTITQADIGNTVTSIGNEVFSECYNMTSLLIPGSMTSIGNDAFSWCSCLTSVTIPEGMTNIGYSAFYGCSGLTNMAIPTSVTSIGNSTFEYCSGLTSVTFEGKDKSTVQGMSNYPFGLNLASEDGVTIHCTDEDIQVSYEG